MLLPFISNPHTEFILYILSSLYSLFSFNWILWVEKKHDGIRMVSSLHNKRYLSMPVPILCALSCISACSVRQCVRAYGVFDSRFVSLCAVTAWMCVCVHGVCLAIERWTCVCVSFSFRLKNNDWLEPKRWNDACSLNAVCMMWYCDERVTSSKLFAVSSHTHTHSGRDEHWMLNRWNERERAGMNGSSGVRVRRSRETNDPISSALWHFDN